MILYIENPKDSIQKLLEVINEFAKIARYKINIKQSFAFFTLAVSERKCKKESFKMSRKLKYSGIKLTKEVKDTC